MAWTISFAAGLVLAAASVPAAPSDPLTLALEGRLACVVPNATKKTCGALFRYIWRRDGTVEQRVEELVDEDPGLSFTRRSVGRIRARSVCQVVVSEDIEDVEFFVDGAVASEGASARGRERMFYVWTDLIGREVCTSFVANGSSLRMVVTADGREVPQFSRPMIWVDPTEGYSVKP
jgi:hypothetical protein